MHLLDGRSYKYERMTASVVYLNLHVTIWDHKNMATTGRGLVIQSTMQFPSFLKARTVGYKSARFSPRIPFESILSVCAAATSCKISVKLHSLIFRKA